MLCQNLMCLWHPVFICDHLALHHIESQTYPFRPTCNPLSGPLPCILMMRSASFGGTPIGDRSDIVKKGFMLSSTINWKHCTIMCTRIVPKIFDLLYGLYLIIIKFVWYNYVIIVTSKMAARSCKLSAPAFVLLSTASLVMPSVK